MGTVGPAQPARHARSGRYYLDRMSRTSDLGAGKVPANAPEAAPRIRSLVSQSLTYGLGSVASRAVGFFLVPVYLHAAGAVAFGIVELVTSALIVVAIILRIVSSMTRFTLGDPERGDWSPVVHTIFAFVMAASTLGVLVGVLFHSQLASLLGTSDGVVYTGLLGLWVTMNFDVMARIYRIERRAGAWVRYTLLNVAVTAVLTVLLVTVFDQGAVGLLFGNFGGTLLVYAIMLVQRRRTIGIRHFDSQVLRELLHFSIPLMPAGLALWALNLADRVQVKGLAGAHDLGVYSAAAKVALGVMVVVGAFQTAWPPFAHSIRGEATAKDTFRLVFSYWAMLMGWIVVALTLLSAPYIALSFPEATHGAIPVVPLLMAGSVMYGGYLVINTGVTFSKKTRMTPVIAAAAAGINIGLNFWAIPAYGIVGAGVTTVIGYAALLYMGWANAQRSYPVNYDWNRVLRVSAVAAAYVAISIWLVPDSGAVPIAVRVLLIGSFPLALFAVGALSRGDRARVAGLLQQRSAARRRPHEPDEVAVDDQRLADEEPTP
jgi:O-antigen/teichoic acid export membrane protein